MSKFYAILLDTFLEIRSSKIIYLYAAITLVLLLVFGLFPSIDIDAIRIVLSCAKPVVIHNRIIPKISPMRNFTRSLQFKIETSVSA